MTVKAIECPGFCPPFSLIPGVFCLPSNGCWLTLFPPLLGLTPAFPFLFARVALIQTNCRSQECLF